MPASDAWKLRVRMYRQGIGDCFLLTWREGAPFHMVIDCGLLTGSPNARETMRAVTASIAEATARRLHLLVGTHEHWDHLSGFSTEQAQDLWDEIQIDRIWLAWTEDPHDAQAAALHRRFDKQKMALDLALGAAPSREIRDLVAPLLGFFGYDGGLVPFAFAEKTRAALDYLHGRRSGSDLAFCVPGEVRALAEAAGLRFFVLGPPRDEKLLGKDRPKVGSHETYEFAVASARARRFLGGASADELRNQFPFETSFRIPDPGALPANLAAHLRSVGYQGKENAWRKIDAQAMATATEIALQMDSDTNNTSLVLAIEVVATGDVLLFPADAQVGNWQSWQQVKWPGQPGLSAADLLRRTVLYKVGHHGSHNATLRTGGLEDMTGDRLVALIPVDREVAARQGKSGWKMPASGLHQALGTMTRGRILQSDLDWPAGASVRPEALSAREWSEFRDSVEVHDLYFDVHLPLPG